VYNFATDLSALKKFARLAAVQNYKDKFATPTNKQMNSTLLSSKGGVILAEAEELFLEDDCTHISSRTKQDNRRLADSFRQ
jgi:microsomal dipeptidase-like Zn-dependent dipeptidase